MKVGLAVLIFSFSISGYPQQVELGEPVSKGMLKNFDEIEEVLIEDGEPLADLKKNACHVDEGTEVASSESSWANFLKLSLLETGTKTISEAFSKLDINGLDCGESVQIDPELKMWTNRTSVKAISYSCPNESGENGAGIFPSVVMHSEIDGKQCFMSFTPDILNEVFRTPEQIRYSETTLAKYATNISCSNNDKIELVVFSQDENNNFKIIKDGSFTIEDLKVFNPYYNLNLTGVGAGVTFNLDGPYIGAAYNATLIGNVMSLYAGTPVTADTLMSTMMMSEESKENIRKYLKDNNISGDTRLYITAANISGKNLLVERDINLDESLTTFNRIGLQSVVGKGLGADGDLTLKLNTSIADTGRSLVRGSLHIQVNNDIEVSGTYGANSTVTATYDIGDAQGVTLGAQASTLGGAGLCAGYFSQKKNGIKKKQGICVSQGGGEYYRQEGCPELYGTSCTMTVTSIFPADGFVDIKTINKMRPGEYYRLENGNLVGLRKVEGEDGEDQYHFQLYQYPEEVNTIRNEIFAREKDVNERAPIVYENLPLDSKRSAREYNSFLASDMIPLLLTSRGKDIKGVRFNLDGSKKTNVLTSDGVLIVHNLRELDESNITRTDVDFSLKRKLASKDEVDSELSDIVNELQKAGVILGLDLATLTKEEQAGFKTYLKFLVSNYGLGSLKGRRIIINDDTGTFLGFGEEAYDFSGTDFKVSLDVLGNLNKLDFKQKVPTDFTPRKPEECKEEVDVEKLKCMQDSFLSVVYSNNFQVAGRQIKFLSRNDMEDIIPGSIYGRSGPKNTVKRVPTVYTKDDVVYVLNDPERIDDYLDPGIFHSPVKSIKKAMIPTELEDAYDVMADMAGAASQVEQVAKNHQARLGDGDAVLYNFKNRLNNQYEFSDVYENDVAINYKGREVSNCFQVKDGIATAFYKTKGESCGSLNTSEANIAGRVDLNNPDKNSPAYKEIFGAHLSGLMDVKELR